MRFSPRLNWNLSVSSVVKPCIQQVLLWTKREWLFWERLKRAITSAILFNPRDQASKQPRLQRQAGKVFLKTQFYPDKLYHTIKS